MFKKDKKLHISTVLLSYEAQEIIEDYLRDNPNLTETDLLRTAIVTVWKQGGVHPFTYRSRDKQLELLIRLHIDVLHEWTGGKTSFSVQVAASEDDTFDPVILDKTSDFEDLSFNLD